MPRRLATLAFLLTSGFALTASTAQTSGSLGPQLRSRYLSLAQHERVGHTTTLLSATIRLSRRDSIFVEATGTVAPAVYSSAGSIVATLDGKPVTSTSTLDWRESSVPVRHSFDVVGATGASAGRHTVKLLAKQISGLLDVSASTNLSVFVHPAPTVVARALDAKAGPFEFTTYGTTGQDTPHTPLLEASVDGMLRTVALGSVSATRASHDGDSMVGLYRDGAHPPTTDSLWSVNDTCSCADPEGPLYTQAYFGGGGSSDSVVSLDASELPWWTSLGENPASYWIEPGARLVVLNGMHLAGRAAAIANSIPPYGGTATDFWCLATDQGWPGCSPMGANVLVAEGVIHVPRGEQGVVMIEGKSRVQADGQDQGGTVSMWLTVDGVRRGSTGTQQLEWPSSVSQRTIATSYLATGNHRLKPGRHVVRLYARAKGSFIHVSLVRDIPLVWFD